MDREQLIKIVYETDSIFFNSAYRADVKEKGKADYVTRADIEISEFLHRRLREEFPKISFMSEEGDTTIDDKGDFFVLDPIDGTTNFMHGLPMCGVSLAYWSCGEPKIGVIYIPYTKEMFSAESGKGAYLNGERIFCSENAKLSDCVGMFEYNAYFKDKLEEAKTLAAKIYTHCQDIRCLGSAAFEMAYVACGRADVCFGRYLKPWDFAAGAVIIKEAGGIVSGLDGKLTLSKPSQHIVAANGAVYREFLELMNK